ncbi:hypothetical protein A4A49_52898 [Nicotiana attenuata]|uniref:Uncharacterized protein n=1 Tax=Nicotiana attenuata TaxID=49451 RepID=A0A1J6IKE5_NICAT|nr:hypothetical protein A4A49_52898 [Nicotiana attenuata]
MESRNTNKCSHAEKRKAAMQLKQRDTYNQISAHRREAFLLSRRMKKQDSGNRLLEDPIVGGLEQGTPSGYKGGFPKQTALTNENLLACFKKELFLRMETTASGAYAEVVVDNPSLVAAQKQSEETPHRRTPPKKQKRMTPSEETKSGNSSKNGTTTLRSHLNSTCHKSPFRVIDKRQSTLKPIKEGWLEGGSGATERVVYNVDDIRRAIAEFVILDEQLFRVFEGEGFKKLMAKALPYFELPSLVTVARHCLRIYHEEKEKLIGVGF